MLLILRLFASDDIFENHRHNTRDQGARREYMSCAIAPFLFLGTNLYFCH